MASNLSFLKSSYPVLDQKAYHGLLGEFVTSIQNNTEADPAAILVQGLVGIGNITGRDSYTCVEATKHRLNMNAVIIGKTSKGRKGTALSHVTTLLKNIEPGWSKDCIMSGLSSGEGLINNIKDYSDTSDEINEPPKIVDKRRLVIEPEFASTLKVMSRDGNILSVIIRDAWDNNKPLQTITKHTPQKASNGHISIIGHITVNELTKYLNSTEIANGFGNRFLWIMSERKNILPEGCKIDITNYIQFADEIKNNLNKIKGEEFYRDEYAKEFWKEIYLKLSTSMYGVTGSLTARGEAQVLRLSCIYAALDGTHVISKDHLEAAYAVWNYCEDTCVYIFGQSTGNNISDKILDGLTESGDAGMSRSDIRDLLSNNTRKSKIDEALRLLHENNLAFYTEPPKGRGNIKETWYSIKYKDSYRELKTYDNHDDTYFNEEMNQINADNNSNPHMY